MIIQSRDLRKRLAATGAAVVASVTLGLAAPAAIANEMHEHGGGHGHGHEGYGMEEHGGWHGHHGRGEDEMFEPHNAAMHFIMMGHELGMNKNQMQQLIKMRDQYIQNNAVAKEQVKADKMDLKWLLMSNVAAQNFDKKAIDGKLQDIKKLKTQLWTAYVDQLQSINQLLTSQQKNQLMTMMSEHAHGGMMHRPMKGGMHGGMGNGGNGMGTGNGMGNGMMNHNNGGTMNTNPPQGSDQGEGGQGGSD